MHRDDLLSQVRIHAHLHGRNQARRVVTAVLGALRDHVPAAAFRRLTAQLPAEVAPPPEAVAGPAGAPAAGGARRRLIRDIAGRLHVDEPDAAFYARTTFEQLNAYCRGTAPAQLARTLPTDLHPLLTARPADPMHRHRPLFDKLGPAAALLTLRAPAAPARDATATPAAGAARIPARLTASSPTAAVPTATSPNATVPTSAVPTAPGPTATMPTT